MKNRMTTVVLFAVCAMLLLSGCGQPAATDGAVEFDQSKPVEAVTTEAPAPTDEAAMPAFEQTAEPTEQPAAAEPSPVEALYALLDATGNLTDMARYSDVDLLNLYGIDVAACQCALGYVNTTGLADQVVLAVASDEAGAESIQGLLQGHVDRLLTQYKGYDATAYATVEKAELFRMGNAVVLLICPEAAALAEICRGYAF